MTSNVNTVVFLHHWETSVDLRSISRTFGQLFGNRLLACMLQNSNFMEFCCRHCDEMVTGAMYRVFSEEDGVTLLDMIVCRSCYDQAKELGLDGEEVRPDESPREQLPPSRSPSRIREIINRGVRTIYSFVLS
jgi:hypothetical protein